MNYVQAKAGADSLKYTDALALTKPHIKRHFGVWAVCGNGRYFDAETLTRAWSGWLRQHPLEWRW